MMRDATTDRQESPVSFPVRVGSLPKAGKSVEIVADPGRCKALARMHGLLDVGSFGASLVVRNWKQGSIRLSGKVTAAIRQQCVVTLEPLETEISEGVDLVLVPETSGLDPFALPGGELVLEAEGPDEPDTFSGDVIDAGAIAEEYFALAIDPYPRRADAELDKAKLDRSEIERPSPFAGLASLKREK